MNQGQKILQMLEAVDNNTSDKTLDEIDARFWCLVNKKTYLTNYYAGSRENPDGIGVFIEGHTYKNNSGHVMDIYKYLNLGTWHCDLKPYITIRTYVRSRDTLKAVRLEHWTYNIHVDYTGGDHSLKQWCAYRYENIGGQVYIKTPELHTEEIAELHAIVQTYIWRDENE